MFAQFERHGQNQMDFGEEDCCDLLESNQLYLDHNSLQLLFCLCF